jgi:TonB family protein
VSAGVAFGAAACVVAGIALAPAAPTVAPAATATQSLIVAGVRVGGSVLDDVHEFGKPDIVSTTDAGHEWQWSVADGLDREVMTDDDLTVTQVLVARSMPLGLHAAASPTPAPPEVPILGLSRADAAEKMSAVGGASIPERDAGTSGWEFAGGVVVAVAVDDTIERLVAMDERTARIRGFLQPPLAVDPYTAPQLIDGAVTHPLPAGLGTAIVRLVIDARGEVADAKVVVGSGDGDVDRWVIENAHRSTFRPATCKGVPCAGVYMDFDGLWR